MDEVTETELASFHRSRVRCLVEGGVDFILLETMPSVKEVEIVLNIIKQYPSVKTIASFSVRRSSEVSLWRLC